MADIEVSPADLKFRFALNKQLLTTITINNPLDKRVAFKVKTTAPKKYVVRPSSGIVEPRSTAGIQVIMQAQKEYPADFNTTKDKFMVQTTTLESDEALDKDTFNKETRKDLREARLRVIIESPAAPPSPVPEANESGEVGGEGVGEVSRSGAAAQRVDLSAVSSENTALKVQLDRLVRERDELRKKLDFVELQGGATAPKAASKPVDPAMKFRVSMVHIILVAIIAFLVGHYT